MNRTISRAVGSLMMIAGAAHAGPTLVEVPAIVIVDLPGYRMVCVPPLHAETPGIMQCWPMGRTATTCHLTPTVRCDIPLPRDPSLYRRAPSDGDPA